MKHAIRKGNLKLGLHILIRNSVKEKLSNLFTALKAEKLKLQSGINKKKC